MSELKPCPFCGNTDIRITRHTKSNHNGYRPFYSPTGEIFSMCCYECGATFPNRYKKELLVNNWNRRESKGEVSSKCQHEWISAENEAITSGIICKKCFLYKADEGEVSSKCPECDGSGKQYYHIGGGHLDEEPCEICGGTREKG